MPDEVIDELSRDERDYDEPDLGFGGHFQEALYHTSLARAVAASRRYSSCHNCGFPGLLEMKTPHGLRLVYGDGPYTGEIHACEDER